MRSEGIEEPHLEVGVGCQRGQQPIRLRRLVPIVQQETHSHPAIRRGQEAVVHELAHEVVVKDIVLQVEGFFRPVDQEGTGGKGIQAGGQKVESRRPRVVNCLGLNLLPQAGPFGPVQGAGNGTRVIIRDGGAPVQEKKEQQA